jgi:GMP synthase-like glutamine amidotransferase
MPGAIGGARNRYRRAVPERRGLKRGNSVRTAVATVPPAFLRARYARIGRDRRCGIVGDRTRRGASEDGLTLVAIIENSPFVGRGFARALHEEGVDSRGFKAWLGGVIPGWLAGGDVAAYILSGDFHDVTRGLREYHLRELELLEKAEGRRIYASCFSHQMIAEWKGGTVQRRPDRILGWERLIVREESKHPAFAGAPETSAICLNIEEVSELPPGAEWVAASEGCKYQAIAYGDEILTCQAHPELAGSRLLVGGLGFILAGGPTSRYRSLMNGRTSDAMRENSELMRGIVRWLVGRV